MPHTQSSSLDSIGNLPKTSSAPTWHVVKYTCGNERGGSLWLPRRLPRKKLYVIEGGLVSERKENVMH